MRCDFVSTFLILWALIKDFLRKEENNLAMNYDEDNLSVDTGYKRRMTPKSLHIDPLSCGLRTVSGSLWRPNTPSVGGDSAALSSVALRRCELH